MHTRIYGGRLTRSHDSIKFANRTISTNKRRQRLLPLKRTWCPSSLADRDLKPKKMEVSG